MHCGRTDLLNHLVGTGKRRWNGKTERLGSLHEGRGAQPCRIRALCFARKWRVERRCLPPPWQSPRRRRAPSLTWAGIDAPDPGLGCGREESKGLVPIVKAAELAQPC